MAKAGNLKRLVADRAAELDRSLREAEQHSGGLVSRSTLSSILRGQRVNVSEDTIRGIALGYELPVKEVERAVVADTKRPAGQRAYKLPDRASDLSPAAFKALMAHMDYLLAKERSA